MQNVKTDKTACETDFSFDTPFFCYDDKQLLVKWLTSPVVLEFYEGRDNPHDIEKVTQHFYDRNDEVTRCMVELDGQAIGYIQFYPLDHQTKQAYGYDENEVIYGTDQFIGESALWNRGIGKLLVRAVIEYLIHGKGASKVVMDPQSWNERAIRCYESCGFKKVKLLPKHEMHEGELKDCWLIEYSPS
ncbi:acetyltransferase [Brevibacillus sp. SYP-B805]|uniref:GNAT family N-acetyltransferase n=1 Tax=Brevibacillus sp. SYP-B805 TaxID=1578199 RepID=UPI0013EAE681|nr:GNAT family N-acetyltransferase [Brevibacillus sp. SYP-B805]NGQ95343.1 acetyltransferase [Brevibacillus sp. SYP-B805]